jgi:hypothetical protein
MKKNCFFYNQLILFGKKLFCIFKKNLTALRTILASNSLLRKSQIPSDREAESHGSKKIAGLP